MDRHLLDHYSNITTILLANYSTEGVSRVYKRGNS